jgi:hypothetical protein
MRRLLLVTLLATFAPWVNAQRMVSTTPHFAPRVNRGGHPRASSFYPLGFNDPFYADYLSSARFSVASQPPVIMLQAPTAAAPVPDCFLSPAEPLMIELQGDRYVRVSGPETSGTVMIEPERLDQGQVQRSPGVGRRPPGAAVPLPLPPSDAKELARAVLVFRDGHREEVAEYAIADGILYSRADYYTDGSWNKKIALAALNLPETVETNRSRGVRFQLPTAPNEVIVRP